MPQRCSGNGTSGSSPRAFRARTASTCSHGIPPDMSWDDAATVPQIVQTHTLGGVPEKDLIEKGPWMYEQTGNGPLEKVKPFTLEVRAEVDNELTDRSIAFIREQAAAKKPFFLYFPFSMGHGPNLPSKEFAGKSRVGQLWRQDHGR